MKREIINMHGLSSGEAYNEAMTNDDVTSGDILDLGNGNIGILVGAYPVVAFGDIEKFHELDSANTTWESLDGGIYLDSYLKAEKLKNSKDQEKSDFKINLVGLPLFCAEKVIGYTKDHRIMQNNMREFQGVRNSISENAYIQAQQLLQSFVYDIGEQLNTHLGHYLRVEAQLKKFNNFGLLGDYSNKSEESQEIDCVIYSNENSEVVKATRREVIFAVNYLAWREMSKIASLDENLDFIKYAEREALKEFSNYMANYLSDYLFRYDQQNCFDYIFTEQFIQENFGILGDESWKKYTKTVKKMPNAIRADIVKKILNGN